MKVSEYRDLISSVHDARVSLLGAVGADEQRREAMALQRVVDELEAARDCHTAKTADNLRAVATLTVARKLLAEKKVAFDRADSNWQAMAFGGEYR